MTDFLKIAKSIVAHFAHICAYGVETVKVYIWKSTRPRLSSSVPQCAPVHL